MKKVKNYILAFQFLSISKLKVCNKHIQYNYHKQNYKGNKDILSMLKYIIEHDKWKYDNEKNYQYLPKNTKKKKKTLEATQIIDISDINKKVG